MQAALPDGAWDVVLSDFHLPAFDGLTALAPAARPADMDIPFIVVSGTIGEEDAVAADEGRRP